MEKEILVKTLLKKIDTETSLSVRALNRLSAAGIMNIGQLVILSDEEILSIPHLGPKTFYELKEFLEDLSLTTKMSLGKKEKKIILKKTKKITPRRQKEIAFKWLEYLIKSKAWGVFPPKIQSPYNDHLRSVSEKIGASREEVAQLVEILSKKE